jgi:hypothetical protein
VAFASPFQQLLDWYSEHVVPSGQEPRLYFVERGNPHRRRASQVEDPHIYLLTWRQCDFEEWDGQTFVNGQEELFWHKDSSHAFFDLHWRAGQR